MLEILILISISGIVSASSALIAERKKRARTKRKLKEFERMSPRKENKS